MMQKILLIGLDGVGKTALYQKFFLKKDPVQLQKITPTRGIAKYEHDFLRTDYTIIDAGGGKQYRQGYIGNTELVKDLGAIVFVVDVQNPPKYQETVNFFTVWLKSVANYIKGVKGYLLFNKIDPGKEGQVKQGLAHIAQLLGPMESMFSGELVKTLTSIYSDSTNQIFQRMLLDLMPKRMSVPVEPRRIDSTPTTAPTTPVVTPPVVNESYITQPKRVEESTTKASPPITPPPVKETITAPQVVPPKLTDPTKTSEPVITPPAIDISTTMEKAEADRIREKTAERLTDIIEATLNNNPGFEAIAVYSEKVELLVGAVKQGGNPQILNSIELTLRKINLEEYMSRLGKVRVGGEGHIKIDTFDIFFEKVSPEHLSTVICSALEEDTIKNIQQLNRYLNQALSITDGADEDTFKRSDLMAELKLRLQNRGKSVDHVG